jgi:histidinol-phosphate aminotransferase
MMNAHAAVARARRGVRDPQLIRPDWTTGARRDRTLLWLDKNENTDPELAVITSRVLAQLSSECLYTYPESAPLYAKLAEWVGLSVNHFLLTAGSDGAIRQVFEAFVDSDDTVLLTEPTFAMYPVYSRMFGARTVSLTYRASTSGPRLDASEIIAAIRAEAPKLVCLPNPNSPTGTVFPPSELREIITTAGEHGALILLDEAYHPFYGGSAVSWIDEFPHLIIARTFAKAWGMAGLRIGYAIAHPAIALLLHKVRPMYEVNTVAVAAMERMLDFRGDMEASVARLIAGRDAFRGAMNGLGLRTLETQGNFTHVAFGAFGGAIHAELANLVLYRRSFNEPCLVGFSRFSAATEDQLAPVIERISRIVCAGAIA